MAGLGGRGIRAFRGSVTACRVQVLLRTDMARVQRVRLIADNLLLLFRLGCQAPVHSACHDLVSRKRCRKRWCERRPGHWQTKRETAHGRRGQCQPRDEGWQGSACAQRSQESGAAHQLSYRWRPPFSRRVVLPTKASREGRRAPIGDRARVGRMRRTGVGQAVTAPRSVLGVFYVFLGVDVYIKLGLI